MNMHTHSKYNYNLIKAKPFQCVPAVLETILNVHGIYSFDQDFISKYFGINVPYNEEVDIENYQRVKDDVQIGVKLHINSLNIFFNKYNISMFETYLPINKISDIVFTDIINKKINEGYHIVCGLDLGFYKYGKCNSIGHVCIIYSIQDTKITLLDPGPIGYGKCNIYYEDLYTAIKAKNDGLWFISIY